MKLLFPRLGEQITITSTPVSTLVGAEGKNISDSPLSLSQVISASQ